ncbi:hypothetical protein Tco_1421340, partial [Tanacetum coccineum]
MAIVGASIHRLVVLIVYDICGGRMNIVKGVAGLIRRTSGYGGEFGVGSPSHRFPVPTPKIQFSNPKYPCCLKKAQSDTLLTFQVERNV